MFDFSKQNSNYTRQNIVNVITQASYKDSKLRQYVMDSNNYIIFIDGDIHRSQWTADNTYNNYWIKVKVFDSKWKPIPGYKALHIYVCYKYFRYDPNIKGYISNCINPPPTQEHGPIADIRGLNGYWEFVNITKSHIQPQQYFFQSNNINPRTPPKKQPSKRLDIINSATGNKIKIATKNKTKGGKTTKKNPKKKKILTNNKTKGGKTTKKNQKKKKILTNNKTKGGKTTKKS